MEDDEELDVLELIKDEIVLPLLDVELVSLMLEEKEVLELLVLKEPTLVNPHEHNYNDSNKNLNFFTLILLYSSTFWLYHYMDNFINVKDYFFKINLHLG